MFPLPYVATAAVSAVVAALLARAPFARYRRLVDGSPDWIAFVRLRDHRILYGNAALAHALGYTIAELVQLRIDHLRPVDDRLRLEADMEALKRRRSDQLYTTLLHKDGSGVDAVLRVHVGKVGGQAFAMFRGRDASQRLRYERTLRAARDRAIEGSKVLSRYRLLAQNALQPIFFVRLSDRRFIDVNAAACETYGYTREEFLSLTAEQVRPPELREGILDLFATSVNAPVEYETLHARKSGETFPVWVRLQADVIEDETIFIGVIADLRSSKEHERELQAARDAAVAASELKTKFIATTSHEIRTPLNAIVGLSELLTRSELDGAPGRQLHMLHSAAQSLLSLTNDLLDFSRFEAGQMELRADPFSVQGMLQDVIATIEPEAVRRGLWLETHVGGNVPSALVGDELRLRQILVNLLGNGVKFTDRGGIALNLERLPDEGGLCRLCFEVRDTGIGLTDEQCERIFMPFVQVDESAARRVQGTGLGLSICRQLVELMGGRIGVVSETGRGSAFWFTVLLPIAHTVAVAPPLPKAGALGRWHGRVLVADDNEINRDLARLQLEQLGLETTLVEDGVGAHQALVHETYDLVFLDREMPGIDGFEAARRIRRTENGRSVPMVAMTAAASAAREAYAEAGFDDVLSKPVTLASLQAMCRRWLA